MCTPRTMKHVVCCLSIEVSHKRHKSPKVHCVSKDRMNLLQIALLLFNQEFKKSTNKYLITYTFCKPYYYYHPFLLKF